MSRSATGYERFQQWSEIPMLIFSALTIPAVIVPLVVDLSGPVEMAFLALDALTWAAFVVEYISLLYLAPNKWEMINTHWFDLILMAVPLLRPLRALRALRLLRVFAGSGRAFQAVNRLQTRKGFRGFLGIAALIVIVGGYLVFAVERTHSESTIDSAGEGLWWAITTMTTVGYGDYAPITLEGRAVAVVLMLVGIAVLSVVTANIAAYFVESDEEDRMNRLEEKIDRVEGLLREVLDRLP
jgi:voltage-gated potassium channel